MDASVFISYARSESLEMRTLANGLIAAGFRVLVDTEDIGPAEVWRKRLSDLIRQSDSLIFLISPASVRSPDCRWELDEAERHAKRIFPVRVQETVDADIPGRLLQINHIIGYPNERALAGLKQLEEALRVDLSWLREHTTFEELAQRWVDAQEDSSRLLRGADIGKAERWRDRRPLNAPSLTEHQRRFIGASRKNIETTARRRTLLATAVAIVSLLVAISMNEMRVASGLSAFEARVTAEANSVIEGMNQQNEAHSLRRALHAYTAAETNLQDIPDVVWNALRLAYAQYDIDAASVTAKPLQALTMPSDGEIVAIDSGGALISYDSSLRAPASIALERPLVGAKTHGLSPSQRSAWARRDNVIRFHDLDGNWLGASSDLSGGEDAIYDAVPGCVASANGDRVALQPTRSMSQETTASLTWSSRVGGALRALRVSIDCDRVLLVGDGSSRLFQKSNVGWKFKDLEIAAGERWSASPNLKFLVSSYSDSRDINRYEAANGDWSYFHASVSNHYDSNRARHGIEELFVNDEGAMLVRVGSELSAIAANGTVRMRSSESILRQLLAQSPNAERITTYNTSTQSITISRSTGMPLFETVLRMDDIPQGQSITSLTECGGRLAIGGSEGSVLVVDPQNPKVVLNRYDARALVRRIDCRDGKLALISSDHGALDVRHAVPTWVPEKLGAQSSYGGHAVFPDVDNGLIVVSKSTVRRYSRSGAVVESIDRNERDDDIDFIGGGVAMQTEPRRLLLLGQASKERNGLYGARACAYLWDDGSSARTVCRASPRHVRFSAGGFLDSETMVAAGLGGNLSIMSLSGKAQLNLDGGPQFVPHAMVRLDESKFALGSFGGELHLWTRAGTLLQPSLSSPYSHGIVGLAPDSGVEEVFVSSGRSVFRTILAGDRLKDRGCKALSRVEGTTPQAFSFCKRSTRLSPIMLRLSPTPRFEALN